MENKTSNNKRLLKNSLMLYLRMFVNMAVSLFTSRLILNALGESDFGIYNVVGGIVVMFTFINGSMTSSTSRYLTISLAKDSFVKLKNTFNFAVTIHFILALIIFALAETVGLWFFYNKLIIPEERMQIAFVLYQLSIATTMLSIMSVPYNSSIISHERMGAFAYISISDVFLKLLIVYAVIYLPWDRLLVYAILLFLTQIINQFVYIIYCRIKFKECRFSLRWDRTLFREMCGFAGWNMAGNFAFICYTQGLNILINMFFGPSVNAARGIAVRVQGTISNFSSNFQTAINPQITKNYATGNLEYMRTLIYAESKFSFFLLLILSLPIMIEADTVLTWWLVNVPQNTVIFMDIMLLTTFVETSINPLLIAALATGNIKKLQMFICPILLCILPVSYICLKLGMPSYSVFVVNLSLLFVSLLVRVYLLRSYIGISLRYYMINIFGRCVAVGIASSILPLVVNSSIDDKIANFVIVCLVCVVSTICCSFILGLNHSERSFVLNKAKTIFRKLSKK